MSLRPFHIAVPVHDLDAARVFYGGLLRCVEGRSSADWVDFNMYGHQFVCHRVADDGSEGHAAAHRDKLSNEVDGHKVPIPHCGVVLSFAQWEELADRLRTAGTDFVLAPTVRFAGQPGEQATMFLLDPSGNALEFKAFRDEAQLFAR